MPLESLRANLAQTRHVADNHHWQTLNGLRQAGFDPGGMRKEGERAVSGASRQTAPHQ